MQQKTRAVLFADWGGGRTDTYNVQFNPKELSFEKTAQYGEITIPGLDAPLQQYVRGNAEKLTVELFFDSTEGGMGPGAKPVTEETDRVFRLIRLDGTSHAPAVVTFCWNPHFPGEGVTFPEPEGGAEGNQIRTSFRGVAESVRQRFSLFSSEGVPLRATVTLVLREFRPLETQIPQVNPNSPNRTHGHVLALGETLSGVAETYYGQPRSWRDIALENGIEDPRRLATGRLVSVPAIT